MQAVNVTNAVPQAIPGSNPVVKAFPGKIQNVTVSPSAPGNTDYKPTYSDLGDCWIFSLSALTFGNIVPGTYNALRTGNAADGNPFFILSDPQLPGATYQKASGAVFWRDGGRFQNNTYQPLLFGGTVHNVFDTDGYIQTNGSRIFMKAPRDGIYAAKILTNQLWGVNVGANPGTAAGMYYALVVNGNLDGAFLQQQAAAAFSDTKVLMQNGAGVQPLTSYSFSADVALAAGSLIELWGSQQNDNNWLITLRFSLALLGTT